MATASNTVLAIVVWLKNGAPGPVRILAVQTSCLGAAGRWHRLLVQLGELVQEQDSVVGEADLQSMAEVPAAALFAARRLTETYGKDLNYLDR